MAKESKENVNKEKEQKKEKNMDQIPKIAVKTDTSTNTAQKTMIVAIMLIAFTAGVLITLGLVTMSVQKVAQQAVLRWPFIEPYTLVRISSAKILSLVTQNPSDPVIYIKFLRGEYDRENPQPPQTNDYLGMLFPQSGFYWPMWDVEPALPSTPLRIMLETETQTAAIMPQRTIIIEAAHNSSTPAGEEKYFYLCLPRTNIPAGGYVVYFYDIDGKPRPAPRVDLNAEPGKEFIFDGGAFPCINEKVPLTFETLDNASTIPVISVPDPVIDFERDVENYGLLEVNKNNFIPNTPLGTPPANAPIHLRLNRGPIPPGGDVPQFPQRDIKINVQRLHTNGTDLNNHTYELCFPKTSMPNPTFDYWFDVFGNPYRDSELDYKAVCCRNPPCGSKFNLKIDSND